MAWQEPKQNQLDCGQGIQISPLHKTVHPTQGKCNTCVPLLLTLCHGGRKTPAFLKKCLSSPANSILWTFSIYCPKEHCWFSLTSVMEVFVDGRMSLGRMRYDYFQMSFPRTPWESCECFYTFFQQQYPVKYRRCKWIYSQIISLPKPPSQIYPTRSLITSSFSCLQKWTGFFFFKYWQYLAGAGGGGGVEWICLRCTQVT